MAVIKVTSKGQVTIPIEARSRLGITDDTYLEATIEGDSLRLRKRPNIRPLSDDDPIWQLLGAGDDPAQDVSERHDHYLAEGEMRRWRTSS